jgi:hypothetical protein
MTAIALPGQRRRNGRLDDLITWAFGVATVVTAKGKAMFADRIRTTPGTYSTSPKFLALGTGATGAARTAEKGNTALTTEAETRTSGTESTVTTTETNDTYQVTGTQTATAERKVDEAGLFDATSVGNMFTSATLNVDTLSSGDSITWTWKVQQS